MWGVVLAIQAGAAVHVGVDCDLWSRKMTNSKTLVGRCPYARYF